MTPPVTNMDQKVITMPQVEQAAPPVGRRRRGVWVAVGVVLAALILGGAVLGAVAIHNNQRPSQTFDVGMTYSQRTVPEHVTVDKRRNIMYINEERVGNLGGLSYLHNFDKKLTAIRDEVNMKCYLTPIHETFQGMVDAYSKLNGTNNAVQSRRYEIILKPVDKDVLRTMAGEEIALHCRDVPTHWVQGESKGECSSTSAANSTVAFRCGEGAVFDPVTFTCMTSEGQGHRSKRALTASLEVSGDCCRCCCCCCNAKEESIQ